MEPVKVKTQDGRETVIREANEGDARDIVDIYNAVGAEGKWITLEDYPFHYSNEALFIRWLKRHGSLLVVAEHLDRVVGYLRLERNSAPKRRHTAELAMAVLKSYRYVGVGTALLDYALDWTEGTGLRKINLAVFSTNRIAVNLYRKFGFYEEGLRRSQIFLEGEYEDEYLMSLFLPRDE